MKKILIIMLSVLAIFTSCQKILFEKPQASINPKENFNFLWNELDQKYSFFDVKNINWDSIKTIYSAKISDNMTDEELFGVLKNMVNELQDGHTNLSYEYNLSLCPVIFTSQDNFDWRIIIENYFNTTDYSFTGPFKYGFLANNQIGYIRFPSFEGDIDENNIDYILKKFNDTKGIILDLRENHGGSASDVKNLLSRFVFEKTLVYYSRMKSGPNHNDFTEPIPTYIEPNKGINYLKNVVMLIDRGTYSAGSFTSLSAKAIPNITLMGDTTGGGLGMPGGGQLPNGWTFRTSITQALTVNDKKPDYEKGVPPDIYVTFDWNDLTKDEILERAIQELL